MKEIREATTGDLESLAVLFDDYRKFYKKPSDIKGAESFLSERIRNKDSVILVAESSSGELAGFTQLYPSFTSLGMARSWVLNDLFVAERYRRSGVARTLMHAAHERCRSTRPVNLMLETQIENKKAQALYESLGYEVERDFYVYSITLPPKESIL